MVQAGLLPERHASKGGGGRGTAIAFICIPRRAGDTPLRLPGPRNGPAGALPGWWSGPPASSTRRRNKSAAQLTAWVAGRRGALQAAGHYRRLSWPILGLRFAWLGYSGSILRQ